MPFQRGCVTYILGTMNGASIVNVRPEFLYLSAYTILRNQFILCSFACMNTYSTGNRAFYLSWQALHSRSLFLIKKAFRAETAYANYSKRILFIHFPCIYYNVFLWIPPVSFRYPDIKTTEVMFLSWNIFLCSFYFSSEYVTKLGKFNATQCTSG